MRRIPEIKCAHLTIQITVLQCDNKYNPPSQKRAACRCRRVKGAASLRAVTPPGLPPAGQMAPFESRVSVHFSLNGRCLFCGSLPIIADCKCIASAIREPFFEVELRSYARIGLWMFRKSRSQRLNHDLSSPLLPDLSTLAHETV